MRRSNSRWNHPHGHLILIVLLAFGIIASGDDMVFRVVGTLVLIVTATRYGRDLANYNRDRNRNKDYAPTRR